MSEIPASLVMGQIHQLTSKLNKFETQTSIKQQGRNFGMEISQMKYQLHQLEQAYIQLFNYYKTLNMRLGNIEYVTSIRKPKKNNLTNVVKPLLNLL